jgi:PHD/YefM family antitoxin component YafN of YafNO toxin-antitoxin module
MMLMVDPMPREESVTKVSSADFAKDPQHYLAEVSAGHAVEITAPREAFVILSKEDFEGYKATADLLSHPGSAQALAKSPAEQEGKAPPRHPLLGALKGLVQVMPGTDLTKPATIKASSEASKVVQTTNVASA